MLVKSVKVLVDFFSLVIFWYKIWYLSYIFLFTNVGFKASNRCAFCVFYSSKSALRQIGIHRQLQSRQSKLQNTWPPYKSRLQGIRKPYFVQLMSNFMYFLFWIQISYRTDIINLITEHFELITSAINTYYWMETPEGNIPGSHKVSSTGNM